MAVEIVAAVECILAEEGHAVWQLGAGLIERATRLPGGSDPVPEFTDLPTLAEVYVRGPLEVLAGGDAARALPEQITGSLRARWRRVRGLRARRRVRVRRRGTSRPLTPMYTGYLLTSIAHT